MVGKTRRRRKGYRVWYSNIEQRLQKGSTTLACLGSPPCLLTSKHSFNPSFSPFHASNHSAHNTRSPTTSSTCTSTRQDTLLVLATTRTHKGRNKTAACGLAEDTARDPAVVDSTSAECSSSPL